MTSAARFGLIWAFFEVPFRESLPMTVTGKIRRQELREAEAAKAKGD